MNIFRANDALNGLRCSLGGSGTFISTARFARKINRETKDNIVLSKARRPNLIFLKADAVECSMMKKLLNVYEKASGQVVNFDKSAMCFAPSINDSKRSYLQSIPNVRSVNNLGIYLSLPSAFLRRKNDDF